MATAITVTIMAITKIITPTSPLPRLALAALSVALLAFAGLNIFSTLTPQTRMNADIAARFETADKLPHKEKTAAMEELHALQEAALMRIPAEPYAWARLSYLRKFTQGSDEASFAALRMSDLVSPNEPRQMLERALMWRERSKNGTVADKERLDQLWDKAFDFQPQETWDMAVQKSLVTEISAALLRVNREAYGNWQWHIEERKKAAPPAENPAPAEP
jgi:hypothetical protein